MPRFHEIVEGSVSVESDRPARGLPYRGLSPALSGVFPLLLAVGNDELAEAAIRVTSALARSKGAIPTVIQALGVDRDAEVVVAPFVGTTMEAALSPEFRNERRNALQNLTQSIAGNVRWRFEIDDLSAADAVMELARQVRPELIVMGLRQHGMVHRAVSGDLLRSIVRATRLPVLAVRPGLWGLPRRIVVAIDFGEASIHAARMARQLLGEGGEMHLMHVATDHEDRMAAPLIRFSDATGLGGRLERLAEDLSPAPGMTITTELAQGDPVLSIKGCAERLRADLIAVGSDHHSPLERLLSGSVSMALAHAARWAMLIVPGS